MHLDRRCRWWTLAGITLMLGVCALGVAVPAGLGWDFANFYDAGSKVLAGEVRNLYDPDVPIGGRPPQGGLKFFGAPISALLYVPFALFPPRAALALFKLASALTILAGLLALYAHTRSLALKSWGSERAYAATFVWLALIFQPFWTVFRVGGQTTPWVFLLLVVGLTLHTAGRTAWSSACFASAVLIKPALAPGLVLLALVSGGRFFLATAAITVVVSAASVAVLGWPVHLEFFRGMASGAGNSVAWLHNSSLTVPVENLRLLTDPGHPTASTRPAALGAGVLLIRIAVLVLFAGLAVSSARQRWTPAAHRHCRFVLAVTFALLISPVVWEHYLALLFIPLIHVVASYRYFDRAALTTVGLAFAFALGQNIVLVQWASGRVPVDSPLALLAVGLVKGAPLWLTLILLWRHRDELWRSYAAGRRAG